MQFHPPLLISSIIKRFTLAANLTRKSLALFFLMLIVSHETHALHQIFDSVGEPIPHPMSEGFSFPNDLEKTNLKITPMGPENPFEWAGPLWTNRKTYFYPCTGGVIAFPNSKPEDKVLVLTAGHCVTSQTGDFLQPKEVLLNQSLGPENIWFDFPRERSFYKNESNKIEIQKSRRFEIAKIVFASFDVVDLALLELDLEYKDLYYKNQMPPILSTRHFTHGEAARAFGIPNSEDYESVLFHQSDCKLVESFSVSSSLHLPDENTSYLLQDRILSNCTLFGGMSGGYVRDNQGFIVAVNGAVSKGYSILNPTLPLAKCLNTTLNGLDSICLENLAKSISNRK